MTKTLYSLAMYFCVVLCSIMTMSDVQAQTSRIYLAGYMGLNTMPDNDFSESASGDSGTYQTDNTLSFAGAIGFRLNRDIRFEGELSYRKNDFSKFKGRNAIYSSGGEISNLALFLNGYYDFDQFQWKAKPYLSAGLGLMRFNASIEPASTLQSSDDDSYALGWQLGGGLKYRINSGLALTGGYRYLSATDFGIGTYDTDYSAHELMLGLEYDLNWK